MLTFPSSATSEVSVRSGLHLLPAALLALATVGLLSTEVAGESDLARMLFSLVYGTATGLQMEAGEHYGVPFSFGYYQVVYALLPAGVLGDPSQAAFAMNLIGWVSALLSTALLSVYVARVSGDERIGVATAFLFAFAPLLLITAPFGHPILPAWMLVLAAAIALSMAESTPSARSAARASLYGVALVLASFALTVRAEVALAFPWFVVASRNRMWTRPWWTGSVIKAGVLAGALLMFLVLQRSVLPPSADAASSLSHFLAAFYSPSRIGKGVAAIVLSVGFAASIAAVLAAIVLLRRRRFDAVIVAAVIALPALVLWLPNPMPARHFFFVTLAAAWLCGYALATLPLKRSAISLAAACVALVVANQVVAELAYGSIVRNYAWSYEPVGARRATWQVPLGFAWRDVEANVQGGEALVEEARLLAATARDRTLIFADNVHYLAAYIVAADPTRRAHSTAEGGVYLLELSSGGRRIVLIEKYNAWPTDVQAAYLADPRFADWLVYVQPSTRSRYDVAEIPPHRRLHH